MKRTVLAAALALLIGPHAVGQEQKQQRPVSNGKAVLRECSITLDLNIYHPRKAKNKFEAFDLGYCLGLVEGVYANTSGTDFCPANDVPTRRVLETVVAFIKAHPEFQDKDGADIVRWALTDTFPCPAKDRSRDSDTDSQARFPVEPGLFVR